MPNKHTRERDPSDFDLPPGVKARSLPSSRVRKSTRKKSGKPELSKNFKKLRDSVEEDDTPRSFRRLMALKDGKLNSGPDDEKSSRRTTKPTRPERGFRTKTSARTKAGASRYSRDVSGDSRATSAPKIQPKIQPGESLSDFSARVNALMPLRGLITKRAADPAGSKRKLSGREKKLHKVLDQWRIEHQAIQDRRYEAREATEDDVLQNVDPMAWEARNLWKAVKGCSKGGKRLRFVGESTESEDDPWRHLAKMRQEKRPGLHDTAAAPPNFKHTPRQVLKVKGSAAVEVGNIPKAAGSLRRREELQEVRQNIIQSYRKMKSDAPGHSDGK